MWAIVLAALTVVVWLWTLRRGPLPVPKVEIDAEGVRRTIQGKQESVRWADLQEVAIATTSDGPMAEDLFYLLLGRGKTGCAVPGSAAGPLLARLQRLPRFDNEAVIKAAGTTTEACFRAWSGEPGEARVCATDVDSPQHHT